MTSFKKAKAFALPTTTEKYEKFVNFVMMEGKKNIARKIFMDALNEIKKAGHVNPVAVWETALENASPTIMSKSKRIGGAVYQVPLDVPPYKRFFFASKWIIDAARSKKGKAMHFRLAEELLAAYNNQGAAVKKKEDVLKMAEANKAFAYLAKYVK